MVERTSNGLKNTSSSLRNRVEELRAKIGRAMAQRADLETSPVPVAEQVSRLCNWIDRQANGCDLVYGLGHFRAPVPERGYSPTLFLSAVRGGQRSVAEADLGPLLCALFGDELKQRLASVIEASGVKTGLPLAERPAMLAKVASELDQLELEEERLIVEAETAGMFILRRDDARPEIILSLDLKEIAA